MREMRVRCIFTEEILGTANSDKDIHEEFIASKAPDAISREEEIAALGVEEVVMKGKTVFHRNQEGKPILFDYQIKGFFKNCAKAFNYVEKFPAYKTKIDNLVFVTPRMIELHLPDGEKLGDCQRPLRAETAQGPRVALANSESCPAGTTIEFTVKVMGSDALEKDLIRRVGDWLDYGALNGIGQWHNSGKGRIEWEQLDEEGNVIGGNHRR
jgi:hypothetical protein